MEGGPFSSVSSLIFLFGFLLNACLQSSNSSVGESVWLQPIVRRQQKQQPGELQVKLQVTPTLQAHGNDVEASLVTSPVESVLDTQHPFRA